MSANFTENELEDIVNQMGQHVETQAQLHRLKGEIDRYLHEEPYMSDDDDVINQSLFASLSIDPAAQFLRQDSSFSPEAIQSPIVSRRRCGKFREYENIEYPEDVEDEEVDEYPEAKNLITQAYRSIGRIYDTCRCAGKVLNKVKTMIFKNQVEKIEPSIVDVIEQLSTDGENTVFDEEGEEEAEDIAESVSVPVSSRSSQSSEPPARIIVDPSVRPVLAPKPGRAPYKFDPVTRYHLYKEEWDRHPAPGEMRRLSLRWKVREYMLRHDVPRLTANQNGRVEHEKDWSPRPYLD